MGYFEFLHGSRIICLPLNISVKLHWQYVFIFVNTIQYLRTLKNNIYHSNKRGPPLFFHLDTNPVIGHALVCSVDKTHVLVVTADLIWLLFLNILSFNFVAAPRKSLKFTRFIRSYVNRPSVVLTNHCQSSTAFLLDVRCSKLPCFSYLQLLVSNDSTIALLSTPVARMLWTPRRVGRRTNVK